MLKKLKRLLDNEMDPAFEARAGFVFEQIENKKPKQVLDIGCGRGFYLNALSLYDFPQKIIGIDSNEDYLSKAIKTISDKRIVCKVASVYSLPFPDKTFDLVILSEVLEHLADEKKAVSEIERVLKNGGIVVVTVPSESFPFLWDPANWVLMKLFNTHVNKDIWFLAGIWAGHLRLYNTQRLLATFTRQGFSVVKNSEAISFSWPFLHFVIYGIGKNIVERLGVDSFNRFDYRKNNLKNMLAKIFKFPSRLQVGEASVNLMASFQKK